MGIKRDTQSNSWVAWYGKRHPITRQTTTLRRIGIKTEREARRVEAQLILAVEMKLRATQIPTWQRLVEDCRAARVARGILPKTVENEYLCLRAHTFEDWGERLADTITTQEIRDLIEKRVGHRSPSHRKNILKFIRGVFSYGVEVGVIQRNPAPQMKFRIGDKIRSALTEEEVRRFLDNAKLLQSEWYNHWVVALYTGMRNGELFALTWDKVNLDDRLIKVDVAWNNKNGFKSTKSGDDRILEIAPNLLTILRQLKLQSQDSVYVLPRIDKWEKGEQARELRMFLMGMGLPTIRFHDLRATWATLMLSKGVEPIKVMKMGGWKDLKTMQFYVRKAGVDIRGASDKLDLHNPSQDAAKVLKLHNPL